MLGQRISEHRDINLTTVLHRSEGFLEANQSSLITCMLDAQLTLILLAYWPSSFSFVIDFDVNLARLDPVSLLSQDSQRLALPVSRTIDLQLTSDERSLSSEWKADAIQWSRIRPELGHLLGRALDKGPTPIIRIEDPP